MNHNQHTYTETIEDPEVKVKRLDYDPLDVDRPVPSSRVTLPHGRHKGKRLSQVPVGYLHWMLRKGWMADHVRNEISRRHVD